MSRTKLTTKDSIDAVQPCSSLRKQHFLLASLVLVSLIVVGCIRNGVASPGGCTGGQCNGGVKLENPRFELTDTTLHLANEYWLKSGDALVVRYDRIPATLIQEGHDCADGPNACHVCDFCRPSGGGGPPCYNFSFMGDIGIAAHESYYSGSPSVITPIGLDYLQGCAPEQPGYKFKPLTNGLYQLVSTNPLSDPVFAETKVYLSDSSPRTIQYQLIPHMENNQDPDVVWYQWSTTGDQTTPWGENFNSTLRVGKVRILQGKRGFDVKTGKLILDETTTTIAHPSRIVLFPNFSDDMAVTSNDLTRCFANSDVDGDIDLARCRRDFNVDCNDPDPNRCLLTATPTYSVSHADKLSWIVEFKTSQGGTHPTLSSREVLVIEFTIVPL